MLTLSHLGRLNCEQLLFMVLRCFKNSSSRSFNISVVILMKNEFTVCCSLKHISKNKVGFRSSPNWLKKFTIDWYVLTWVFLDSSCVLYTQDAVRYNNSGVNITTITNTAYNQISYIISFYGHAFNTPQWLEDLPIWSVICALYND